MAAFHLTLTTLVESFHLCLSNVKQGQNARKRYEH